MENTSLGFVLGVTAAILGALMWSLALRILAVIDAHLKARHAPYYVRKSCAKWYVNDAGDGGYFSKSWCVEPRDEVFELHDPLPCGKSDDHLPVEALGGPGHIRMDTETRVATMQLGMAIPRSRKWPWSSRRDGIAANWTYRFDGSPFLTTRAEVVEISYTRYGVELMKLLVDVPPHMRIRKQSVRLTRLRCDFLLASGANLPNIYGGQETGVEKDVPKHSIVYGPFVLERDTGRQCIAVAYRVPRMAVSPNRDGSRTIKGFKDSLTWEWE